MAPTPPLRVPDPSATIPDFGPRPDAAQIEKIARAKHAQDVRDGLASPIPEATPRPAKSGMHPAVIVLIGLLVAAFFGAVGFGGAIFVGLLAYGVVALLLV